MWFNIAVGSVLFLLLLVVFAEIRRNKVSDYYLSFMFFYAMTVPFVSIFALVMHIVTK